MLNPAHAADGLPLDRQWIARHVPHAGRMCLLDAVTGWDAVGIECISHSHTAADHPLRAHGRLGAACGVEYAAQAMALHGALLGQGVAPGLLMSVRALKLRVERLDDAGDPLLIHCSRVGADAHALVYDFRLQAGGRRLLDGRAAIALGEPA